jgi:hypothetical protein
LIVLPRDVRCKPLAAWHSAFFEGKANLPYLHMPEWFGWNFGRLFDAVLAGKLGSARSPKKPDFAVTRVVSAVVDCGGELRTSNCSTLISVIPGDSHECFSPVLFRKERIRRDAQSSGDRHQYRGRAGHAGRRL